MNKKHLIFIGLILLTLIALLLRVLPFGYGMTHTDFSDTGLFSEATKLANGIAQHDFSQFKTPDQYPYFFPYVFVLSFGIFYLIGIIGGIFSSAGDFLRYAIVNMENLFEISRIIVAVLGALLIPIVYLVTYKIISAVNRKRAKAGAFLAAILMCFSLVHIEYSHFVRPHLLVAFFLFLSFYFYLLLLEKKKFIFYILLALVCGFTAGTLHNGLLSFLFLVIANFFITKFQPKKFFSLSFIVSLLIFCLVVFMCWPYMFFNLKTALGTNSERLDISLSGQTHDIHGAFEVQGYVAALRELIRGETSLAILLAIFLIIYFIWVRKKEKEKNNIENYYYKAGIRGGIIVFLAHFLVFSLYHVDSFKFLAPLVPFLCFSAGILFVKILDIVSRKYRFLFVSFVAIIMVFSVVQSVRFTTLIVRTSTRDLAADWIDKNIDKSKMVTVSSSGPKLFPSQESLTKKLLLAGPNSLGRRNEFLLSMPPETYPKNSRLTINLGIFYQDPRKILNFLKNESDYFVFSRYNLYPGFDPEKDFEQKIALSFGEPIKIFNPFRKDSVRAAQYPSDAAGNPIIDFWVIDRMGPYIEIYKLR